MTPSNVKRTVRRALTLAAVLALGTATAKDEERPYLFLRTPQNAFTVQVTGKDINSADFQLTHDGKSLRGRAFDQVVFLSLGEDTVGGTVGSQLARLRLQDKDGTTQVKGNFMGSLVDFSVGPQGLTGVLGRCGYELKANANGLYEGSRSCGGIPQRPVLLSIPENLTQQGTPLTVATLAMLLGNV